MSQIISNIEIFENFIKLPRKTFTDYATPHMLFSKYHFKINQNSYFRSLPHNINEQIIFSPNTKLAFFCSIVYNCESFNLEENTTGQYQTHDPKNDFDFGDFINENNNFTCTVEDLLHMAYKWISQNADYDTASIDVNYCGFRIYEDKYKDHTIIEILYDT